MIMISSIESEQAKESEFFRRQFYSNQAKNEKDLQKSKEKLKLNKQILVI